MGLKLKPFVPGMLLPWQPAGKILYPLSGQRISPVYDLSVYGTIVAAEIRWSAIAPSGTQVVVESRLSFNGGVTWTDWRTQPSGTAIQGLTRHQDISSGRLQVRQTLTTTNVEATPELVECYIEIESEGSLNSLPEDHVTIFDGIMDAPVITETAMQVTVVSKLDMLGFRVPRRRYQRLCNWKFGSTECGADLGTVTGTVEGISGDGLTLTLSGRTEGEDYFKDGVLTIEGQWQRVISSNGQTFVVDYPFVGVEVGDDYSLRRGCDKTFEACRDRFGNQNAFGGYLSIPAERVAVGR